jgi:hypothetical protein
MFIFTGEVCWFPSMLTGRIQIILFLLWDNVVKGKHFKANSSHIILNYCILNYILNELPDLWRSLNWSEDSCLKFYIVYLSFFQISFYCRFLIALLFSFCSISTFPPTNVIPFLICNRWPGISEWIFRNHGKPLHFSVYNK